MAPRQPPALHSTLHGPVPHVTAVGHAVLPSHRMVQLVARVQSTPLLQTPFTQRTRHGTPAGHVTAPLHAVTPQSMTQRLPSQVPVVQAARHAAVGALPPEPDVPPLFDVAPPL